MIASLRAVVARSLRLPRRRQLLGLCVRLRRGMAGGRSCIVRSRTSSQRGNALLQNAYSVGYPGLYDDAGATVEAQQTAYRLNVDAKAKYLNASGTWTDPNAIGAAGHSGGAAVRDRPG